MTSTAAPRARLDIVSDVVCPWCYIGKHRLARALERIGDRIALDIRWRPFELNPTLPAAGMDRREYCTIKFGSIERARQLYENVVATAHADGLPMRIERITRTPNTRLAHRLIEIAREHGCQDVVVDALFEAYFVDGRDIGDLATLIALGSAAGMAGAVVETALADAGGDAVIERQEHAAHELGVSGVPAFLYNDRLLFSGAQSAETIALAIQRAAARGL